MNVPFSFPFLSSFPFSREHNWHTGIVRHNRFTRSHTTVKTAGRCRANCRAPGLAEGVFGLAHFGNPWRLDAAEVMYKNEYVWADVCAILVGDATYFAAITATIDLRRTVDRCAYAMHL